MLEYRNRQRFRVILGSPQPKSGKPGLGPWPRLDSSFTRRWADSMLAFSVIFFAILVPHLPLLTLPYFWDEAGYYIPAARDLLLTGTLIPHTTLSNAHPPLVMIWLASWWKLMGFSPLVTRAAMLVIAAITLTGVYRLAYAVANREVAVATTVCTALFPPFFAQSTLAHLDMAAAALTIWGLLFYIERRTAACVIAFSLAALGKETAVIAPIALFFWELASHQLEKRTNRRLCSVARGHWRESLVLLLPLAPLFLWYTLHWTRTGVIFGNAGFFRYNVAATLNPVRAVLALIQRVWQLTGYLNMYLLTLAMLAAMFYAPLAEGGRRRQHFRRGQPEPRHAGLIDLGDQMRQRIAIPTQLAFAAVMLGYVAVLSIIGGALLERYLLPVIPLWIMLCVSTLRRRIRMWRATVAVIAGAFVLASLFPPPYRIAPEDTLAYRDFVELHVAAARQLQLAQINGPVLTAWPASDELQRPFLGYVNDPIPAITIENFSAAEVERAAARTDWNTALVFSTKYEPLGGSLLDRIGWWKRVHQRWFGYHDDLSAEQAADMLHADVAWTKVSGPQWIAILRRR